MINLTEPAAQKILELTPTQDPSSCGLRIFVEKGGCSGLQYSMQVAPAQPGDLEVLHHGARVYLDESSALYLKGSTIDYEDTLSNAGFRIQNPNAKQTCGCGTSFEA
ncbi:MAG: HesB/IscA family protein [Candidatus Methylacidiphilales bacterium]